MKIHPTGSDALIEEDRPALLSIAASHLPQVFLDYFDPIEELHVALGWFAVADLQKIIDAARGGQA